MCSDQKQSKHVGLRWTVAPGEYVSECPSCVSTIRRAILIETYAALQTRRLHAPIGGTRPGSCATTCTSQSTYEPRRPWLRARTSAPEQTYQHNGWKGYGHWLGTGNVGVEKDQQYLPFKKALLYERCLKTKKHLSGRCGKRPLHGLPTSPPAQTQPTSTTGGKGYGHWLGTGKVGFKQDQPFLPFKEALLHARSLKLKRQKEWAAWCKIGKPPANMPAAPADVYTHGGWQGWGHWLGTGNVGVKKDQPFLPFKEALLQARSLKLKNVKEWKEWRKSGARPAPSRTIMF